MNRVFGIALVVLALGIGVIPAFTDCQSQGKTMANGQPMKCHWTGKAEIATALPLAAVGVMMTTTRKKNSLFALSAAGGVMGIAAIMLPTALIGVCGTMSMGGIPICNTVMRPALVGLGSVTALAGIGMMVLSRRSTFEA